MARAARASGLRIATLVGRHLSCNLATGMQGKVQVGRDLRKLTMALGHQGKLTATGRGLRNLMVDIRFHRETGKAGKATVAGRDLGKLVMPVAPVRCLKRINYPRAMLATTLRRAELAEKVAMAR